MKVKVGIAGFGNLGQFLFEKISLSNEFETVFLWNRSKDVFDQKLSKDQHHLILDSLNEFHERKPELVIEVAHPSICAKFGASFLSYCHFMIGSPTAMAEYSVANKLRAAAKSHCLYVPSGAFWGGEDIKKMASRGTLQKLSVSMSKHPSCFRLEGPIKSINDKVQERTVLYQGSVGGVCPLAPNNVNTMAVAAIVAEQLGFDGVEAQLISDPNLSDFHVVEIEAWGPGDIQQNEAFHVKTVRTNPAKLGVVTGSATYNSFWSSLLNCANSNKACGVHLC